MTQSRQEICKCISGTLSCLRPLYKTLGHGCRAITKLYNDLIRSYSNSRMRLWPKVGGQLVYLHRMIISFSLSPFYLFSCLGAEHFSPSTLYAMRKCQEITIIYDSDALTVSTVNDFPQKEFSINLIIFQRLQRHNLGNSAGDKPDNNTKHR